jgi:3-phenylpropionate/trans-cinnamate dioxygenase ferredoxin reductase subunit
MLSSRVVIVGAGQAACELAFSLRKEGHTGSILILGEESHAPYQRPPLSKAFLAGQADIDALLLRPAATYEKARIDLRTSVRVIGIDRKDKVVMLGGGARIAYDRLVLATGGNARRLPGTCALGDKLMYVRTIDDVIRLRSAFLPGRRLLVIGGGYIGLEAAAVARAAGLHVTLLETAPRLLARVACADISAFYATLHRRHGVDIRLGVQGLMLVDGVPQAPLRATLADGQTIDADFAIAGIGLIPNVGLAEAAGLTVADGICIDAFTRTSDPDIMAIGDCANYHLPLAGRRLRIESVQNAIEQARVCAANLCGRPLQLDYVPWFWSDQYHLKLQMAGLSLEAEHSIVRGEIASDSFIVFYLKNGRLVATDAVNRPADFMLAKKLIAQQTPDITGLLADPRISLKSIATGAAGDARGQTVA